MDDRIAKRIEEASPLARRLSQKSRIRLLSLVKKFLERATFQGAGNFIITPEVRITIATHACMLLVNRRQDQFPGRIKIIVHGDAIDNNEDLMGRYRRFGLIDLNWDDVIRGGYYPSDGCNVVMHEFAHKLDETNVLMDGVPQLHSISCHLNWLRIMREEYSAFCTVVKSGEFTYLNPYAATHPAEFFACATEALFEKPDMLKKHYPRVHDRLSHFYGDGRQ